MPRLVIAQPLPQDLRNGSFRGMNCEGWDFEGRDIRGCDFRNAKLKGANFSQVIAGRSRKQIIVELLIAVIFVVALAVSVASMFAGAVIFAVTVSVTVAFAIIFAVVFIGLFVVAFIGIFVSASALGVAGWAAIDVFSEGRIPKGIFFSVIAIVCLIIFLYFLRESIREFKNLTGTNFKGADLQGVNFSHATLNNCNFDQADTRYVNWSHVEEIDRRSISTTPECNF